ncbi:MAG: hypothetical protein PSX42_02245 [bacterium]|nr:hypothetical protein [bacterium]
MKAETLFNVAIHLSDYELQRLNKLIGDKLKLRTKKLFKKPILPQEENMIRLIKTCFTKIKE